ncbi:MAG: phenylalanine--tRNA ligase subunit beta [Chlamydiota bacterium]
MRLLLSWLKDYLDPKLSVEKLAERLTLIGLEVDAIYPTPLSFAHVIVAEVRDVSPHPNADQLKIAEVFDGTQCLPIVCGDPRCRSGMKTALAQIGASLTDEKGKRYTIKKTKLRGIHSHGMLCSEKELGLSEKGNGIMSITSDIPAGTPLETLYSDTVFDISLTPNLGHCMSVLGIARELSALLDCPLTPSFSISEDAAPIDKAVQIDFLEPENTLSYHCRLICDCRVGPSPDWLQKRLEYAGLRSVNNIVDVTNYIMLDLGLPLHAFDYDRLKEPTISVRSAPSSFSLDLIDGKTHSIPAGTLIVYAGNDPIAVAGVMGSAHSEVGEKSRHILLEAAHFTPEAVRKSSKILGMRSEASARFERGIDPENIVMALDRAATLIAEIAGGAVSQKRATKIAHPWQPRSLRCSTSNTNRLLGTTLSASEVEAILRRLEMNPKSLDRDHFQVEVPSYRNDINLEIDLIEEIARLFGYNNIPRKVATAPVSSLPHSPLFLLEKKMRQKLLAEGLQEFLTCNLISPISQQRFNEASLSSQDAISVLRPSSTEQSVLRLSLLPPLLQSLKVNFNAKQFSLAAFEIGRIHFKEGAEYKERPAAAIILTGKARPHHWKEKPRVVDFFDLKGIVENIFECLGIANPIFSTTKLGSFHPQKQANIKIGSLEVGSLGEVSPQKLLELDIKQPVFFAELDLLDLLTKISTRHQMAPLPLYPESERDWTFIIPPHLSLAEVLDAIYSHRSKFLKRVTVWDLYEGKSITLRFTYRNDRETIEHAQVEKEHTKIMTSVTSKLSLSCELPDG